MRKPTQTRRTIFRTGALIAALVGLQTSAALADFTVNIYENGPDVVASITGRSLTSGNSSSMIVEAGLQPGSFLSFAGGFTDDITLDSSLPPFGSGPFVAGIASLGSDVLAINSTTLFLPDNFTIGEIYSGTVTFPGTTLAGIGLNEGLYTAPYGGTELLSVDIGNAPVPEPSTGVLLGLALLFLRSVRSRR